MVPVISPITGTRAATEGRSDAISITGGDVRTTGGDETFDETFDDTSDETFDETFDDTFDET